MNGQTTICARAVELAAQRGIIVVTAAGNEAITPWKYIVTPGDADTAITVGAVDASGVIASLSSLGPTSDGRIKPDVCAQGRTHSAHGWAIQTIISMRTGRRFRRRLSASAVALILISSIPASAPRAMQNALPGTATLSYNPDTAYGWGIAQALDAALSFGMIFSNPPRIVRDSATGNSRLYTAIKALDRCNGHIGGNLLYIGRRPAVSKACLEPCTRHGFLHRCISTIPFGGYRAVLLYGGNSPMVNQRPPRRMLRKRCFHLLPATQLHSGCRP